MNRNFLIAIIGRYIKQREIWLTSVTLLLYCLMPISLISKASAQEVCFAEVPDSAFKIGSFDVARGTNSKLPTWLASNGQKRIYGPVVVEYPAQISEARKANPKDYIFTNEVQIQRKGTAQWVPLRDNLWRIDLALIPGDRVQSIFNIEGRNCEKRSVYVAGTQVNEVAAPSIDDYVKSKSKNFQEEEDLRKRLPLKFPITETIKIGLDNSLSNVPLPVSLESFQGSVVFNFTGGCAQRTENYGGTQPWISKNSTEYWGGFTFTRPGNCIVEIFHNQNPSIDMFRLGTINITVEDEPLPKPSASTASIKCVKGKAQRVVTGVAPKCPKGFTKKP